MLTVGRMRKPDLDLNAVMEELRDVRRCAGVVADFSIDSREPLERWAEGNVQDRAALTGGELGKKLAVNRFSTVGSARSREALQAKVVGRWFGECDPFASR